MLELKELIKVFNRGTINEKPALNGLSLSLEAGDFVTVIGGNGAGKSTTMNAISGVFPVDRGEIIINGHNVTKLPEYKRAAYIGRVFQDPMRGTCANMQIEENLAIAYRRGQRNTLRWSAKSKDKALFRERLAMLDLGLENRMSSRVGLLSGGQRQRVALARALVIEPKLLLLDEPLSNLDAKLRLQMRLEIKRIQQQFKITTLFVTHDQEECFSISDKVAVMNNGIIEQYGTPEEIYQHPTTEFVARFIGFENFIKGTVQENHTVQLSNGLVIETREHTKEGDVTVTIRPDHIELLNEGDGVLPGEILVRTFIGKAYQYEVKTEVGVLLVNNPSVLEVGSQVSLSFPKDHVIVL